MNATRKLYPKYLMKCLREKRKMFREPSTGTYKIVDLRNLYEIIISLIYRLYGNNNANFFKD